MAAERIFTDHRLHALRKPIKPAAHIGSFPCQPDPRHLRTIQRPQARQKQRREEALANATGIRVLNAIVAAVPVRLMKRDLLFIAESLLPLLDERRLAMVARNRSIKAKEGESIDKLMTAFLQKADEGALGAFSVEAVILLSARSQSDGGKALRAAAQAYKVDTDAIALKVKQEFAAKEKAKRTPKPEHKPTAKAKRVA